MKGSVTEEWLYLDFSHQYEDCIFPLHSSVALFLLSYCDCKLFKVFLVPAGESADDQLEGKALPSDPKLHFTSRCQLPLVVQNCCLPAIVGKDGKFCRAGLAVVLRYIVQKTYEADPSNKEALELLGFKKTCLKACAEVSQWTRLCEISIPLAVESFLTASPEQCQTIPPEVLQLEKKLGEPVRVHNDDKIRRQKLQQQNTADNTASLPALAMGNTEEGIIEEKQEQTLTSLELRVAFSKLTVQEVPATTNREPPLIRKMKTSDLPPLEHIFAEGLYFTLADLVLLPCIHQFLLFSKKQNRKLLDLPLILGWYQRVQEVPGVKAAASKSNMQFLQFPDLLSSPEEHLQDFSTFSDGSEEDHEDKQFIGGPRPTMTKLMERGIEATFSPHPTPCWTLDWSNLPAAVNPGEGKMSSERALRKQQQLNNLVAMVTNLSKPGNVIVDFCSGGGHVGIVLAHMLPSCQVALHACGVATDMVIEHCIKVHAAFVICPCCYGFIQNTAKFTFPRSHRFKEVLSYKEHMILCRFADQTAVQLPPERKIIGKQCMGLVDLDRAWAAEAYNYSVQVISMEPESCSPKNNMVVGIPV
ncbi:PREDICTED: glutathione S-transferase C-terminal domain-containing protein isoform X2 [Gavialis gangeticus]|uniref:glutathione S-transferase C-terminal domain-containing protein isoform X2 n=1 Tax=Gavialis gangeticus TaxID=94835 RepID=UPI00092EA377|nr:PREDICTED: glutathione S-transferase C-terminal domain-containing protein isoform X2 [Gavialis gangeticus]